MNIVNRKNCQRFSKPKDSVLNRLIRIGGFRSPSIIPNTATISHFSFCTAKFAKLDVMQCRSRGEAPKIRGGNGLLGHIYNNGRGWSGSGA